MRTSRARLRVFGAALAIYGLIGIVMFAVIALGVARPLERARQLSESVDQERAALVASLGQAETTIRGMSTSVTNMDTSLGDATTAIDQATSIAHQAATSMYGLRDAMSLSILGAQPLIGLAGNFDTTGQNLDQLGTDVAAIGTALDQNRADVTSTSQNLTDLADSVHALAQTVQDGPAVGISSSTLDAIRLTLYAVTAWMTLFAAGCVAAGLYLLNLSRRRAAPA
jgi:uncharacterized protein YoxC